MLECLILKRLLTVLATILCILIVLGDVLVVQPPFMFTSMSVNHEVNDTNLSSMTTTATDLTNSSVIVTKTVEEAETVMARQGGQGYTYWVGVGLVLFAGFVAALANVVQVILIKEKSSITTNHHVIIGGI